MSKTYGTVFHKATLDKTKGTLGFLHIHAEPHVSMVLRRVFPGATRTRDNAVVVSASEANCSTLEWVMVKYPLVVESEIVAHRARRMDQRMAMVESTRADDYAPPTFELAVPLRDYQNVAVDLMLRSKSLLLADTVGLGKTASVIGSFTNPDTLPAIVVTLTHLTGQWQREIKRFAPKLRTHVISSGTAYALADNMSHEVVNGRRRVVRSGIKHLPDVIILNYHKLPGWADALRAIKPGMVAFDEVHELRTGTGNGGSTGSKRNQAAKAIADVARYKQGCSATPIFGYGGEIWNVMDTLAPGLLGTRDEFHVEWCTSLGNGKYAVRDPNALRLFLAEQGAMLRRRREDVGRELPPMQRIWHTVELDQDGLKAISERVEELARAVLGAESDPFARMRAAADLDWQLRQATGLAKVPGVLAFVQMIIEGSDDPATQSVILYAHHHLVFDALMDGFAKLGIKSVKFTGKQSIAEKAAALDGFINGDTQVLIISNRAGAGIDGLQHVCNTVVTAELDWSPAVHIQAEGRADRDGQQHSVMSVFLVADEGSDPVIRDTLGLKDTQRRGLVDGDVEDTDEEAKVDPERMKKLAHAVLAKAGKTL